MSSSSGSFAIPLGLAVVVAAIYARVLGHAFVEFDDPLYVGSVANAPSGLGTDVFVWAFSNDDAFLFHPLTWLSYRVDHALHGVEWPGGWLITSVGLHAATAGMLYRALCTAGAAAVPSAIVAALFAVHPIQVESVAWVSGRKDVLAGFFCVASLWAYADWARHRGARRYGVWNALAILALLSKGAAVVLPFLLLLLDLWPLRRLRPERVPSTPRERTVWWPNAAREKLPIVLAGGVAVLLGFEFSSQALNVWVDDPPLWQRIAAVPSTVIEGLVRVLWPHGLSIFYPSRVQMGLSGASALSQAGAALSVLAITGVAIAVACARPYVWVGWIWFVGALVPALGIVPIGLRTLHDRYLYLPMVGLAIVVAFSCTAWIQYGGALWLKRAGSMVAVAVLLTLGVLSSRQVAVWQSSTALFDHALRVAPRSAVAHYSMGIALARAGHNRDAGEHLRRAIEIHPRHADANTSFGWLLLQAGRPHEALVPLRRAVAIRPDWGLALTNLGNALLEVGEVAEALVRFESAVRVAPKSADARYWLGAALARQGRRPDAIASLHAALRLRPDHAWAGKLLASLEQQPRAPFVSGERLPEGPAQAVESTLPGD